MNILNKLTIKHLKMNKKRTTVTIIGIILSTALMVGIGSLMSSFREYSFHEAIESNGKQHITIKDVDYENYKYIEKNVYVEDSYLNKDIGFSILEKSKNDYKPYLFLKEVNQSYFESMKLIDGRYPKNENELLISEHIKINGGVEYNIGDTITLNIGQRYGHPKYYDEDGNIAYDEEKLLTQAEQYIENERLEVNESREFKIVGIIKRPYNEPYSSAGYTVLTKLNENKINPKDKVETSIIFKNTSNIKKKSEDIYNKVKKDDEYIDLDYNNTLLSLYGQSQYSNINSTMISVVAIILGLIAIGCAIVIYNSFAISVMERKKQFGLFSSIGATKSQLKKTVFFEAFIVGLIGIPIGLIGGIFGIWVVLKIVDTLLTGMFSYKLSLALYPLFIIIPIIYMIVTIMVSAFLPARKASKISPIEAIRLNDDIKIKGKKVKTNRFVRKIFGIEGDLALKNIKRNKKKYRITILSLFISIVLFISFSSLLEYGTAGSRDFFGVQEYDIAVEISDNDIETVNSNIERIKNIDGINDYSIIKTKSANITISKDKLTNETLNLVKDEFNQNDNYIDYPCTIISIDDEHYKKYVKSLGLNINDYNSKTFKPIAINYTKHKDYINQKINTFKILKLKNNEKLNFKIYNYEDRYEDKNKLFEFESNIYQTTKIPKYLDQFVNWVDLNIIINDKMYDELLQMESKNFNEENNYIVNAYISADEHVKVTKEIRNILKVSEDNDAVFDIALQMQQEKNFVTVIKIFLYGFISLVTLIGVTSVFNTINTSIALRRKEFAVLRSIGLTPKGFNKMMCFESLFYGMKALLYGIPVSFGVVYLFHLSFGGIASYNSILIPWRFILIAIVSVFVIIFITMMYASSKIKKENILDAIREENI